MRHVIYNRKEQLMKITDEMLNGMEAEIEKNIRERKDRDEKKYNGPSWLKVPEGTKLFNIKDYFEEKKKNGDKSLVLKFDIIPFTCCDGKSLRVAKLYDVHRGIGAKKETIVCPKKEGATRDCPVCDEAYNLTKIAKAISEKLKKNGISEPWKVDEYKDAIAPAKTLFTKQRQLFNILLDNELYIFDYSYSLFGKALDAAIELDRESYISFANINKGYTIIAGFEEKKYEGHSFFAATQINFKERKEPLSEKWIERATDLNKILNVNTDLVQLNTILMHGDMEEEEEVVPEIVDNETGKAVVEEDDIPMDYSSSDNKKEDDSFDSKNIDDWDK
jgi:hypothetical protein